ncbi:hypothetical protein DQ04_11381010 [Trypanosoma grayi]|uniref:hypothetical protein n=1 Tax=Trypanosoma grayi TaxID=71804 RepID=UPI0004F480E3|nr:hypothetical protein DQ04_11381010 [Trypanosoma grayi]KEG06984.1 hypothetical protein DQ04_11381010 [Trypanosoma grayi]
MHFTGTSPGQAYDLEVVLTELLAKAEKAEAAGVRVREHPSVAFYRGDRPARVQMPPQDGGDVRQTDSCMYVIALHQALLPPCEGVVPTEEQQSARMSSSDGLELLRVNWEWLLWLLMPSVRLGSPTNGKEECNNNNNNNDDEEQSASAPICSTRELCRKLEWGDYTQLRQPGLMDRVHYSYVVFLRFYGWRLHDEERGVLDRHQNWKERYKLLSRACDISGGSRSSSKTDEHEGNGDGHASSIGFYDALTRILYVLLELCFTRYAVNLVAFLLEEMNKGRLLFLQPTLEKVWFSQVDCCKQVADAEKKRLRRQLYCLTHSDSD